MKEERQKIEKEAKKKAENSISKELKDLQEQIKEKDEKLEIAEDNEIKLRKEKRELDEDKRKFKLDNERKLEEGRKKIFEEAVKITEENHDLKDKEKQKIIDDLKTQIHDLQRKSEQGSQKLQGEVLEEELEKMLKNAFPRDDIEPISSGVVGADVIQKVYSQSGKISGKILFESKNANNWGGSWITKLKKDMIGVKADIGVIVAKTLPEGIDTFGCIEKIIIVHYKLVVPVTVLLRNQLLEVSLTKGFGIGKNEKMESLYTYLTSTEFRQKIESIVGAFKDMNEDLDKEKRATMKQWAKREKQVDQLIHGVASMYGNMQGLIGSSLQDIKLLEMQESNDNDEKKHSEEEFLVEDDHRKHNKGK